MKNLFFYGTMRHMPLLEIVLGGDTGHLGFEPATLAGFTVSGVAEGPFPMIARDADGTARGLLARGLQPPDVARLDYYEGGFAYDLEEVTLENGERAEVYVPQPDQWTADGPWSLEAWEAQWGALSRFAAREVMGYFGTRSREEVAAIYPRIRARAQAQVNAGAGQAEETRQGRIDIAERNRVYSRFFALDEMKLRYERFDGTMSQTVDRAVFVGTDAAILLPYDPLRDRVLLIEQMRMGPLARGDSAVWQLEPIAGGVDPGETAEQAAHREAAEEARLKIDKLETVAKVYASPGNATEFFHIFLGLADLPDGIAGIAGLDAENEDIRSHVMSFDDLIAMADRDALANAPLVLAVNWLARHRDRLRSDRAGATPE